MERVIRRQSRVTHWTLLCATLLCAPLACATGPAREPADVPLPAASDRSSDPPETVVLFDDDFESGLDGWTFPLGRGHGIVDDGSGNRVLRLRTVDLPVYALVDGSGVWDDVRIEGRVLFPVDDDSYLGFIYRYVDDRRRIDFGSVYVKGNGSYVQANVHHDTNVGRTLYPEVRASLAGARAVRIGSWQRFALEVVGAEAHLYVGDMTTPALTLPTAPHASGAFGFKPRNPGADVWIDDVRITAIDRFSYDNRPIPESAYHRDTFVTDWHVIGPMSSHAPAVEGGSFDPDLAIRSDGRMLRWRPFAADHRGAVATGRATELRGSRRVAYFHARVEAARTGDAELWLSTVDDLAIWVNGKFVGFAARQGYAWWDVDRNAEHAPVRAAVPLREGPNDILVRAVGGTYASGGFYMLVREGI